jgi:hypothetical protein
MMSIILAIFKMDQWRAMACGEIGMEISILASGRAIKPMDMAYTSLVPVIIKVNII